MFHSPLSPQVGFRSGIHPSQTGVWSRGVQIFQLQLPKLLSFLAAAIFEYVFFPLETIFSTDTERPNECQPSAMEVAVFVYVSLWLVLIWSVVSALAAHQIPSLSLASTE
jgi:hypothetical protein